MANQTRQSRDRLSEALRFAAKLLTWMMVASFLIGGGAWAMDAGINLRHEIWQSTRTVRFTADIWRGFRWGNDTLRFAEMRAGLEPMVDARADQSSKVLARAGLPEATHDSPTFRRLTTSELMGGLIAYMDDVVQNHPNGDYILDYPPLRLAVMTLWVRHVQRLRPDMESFPGRSATENDPAPDEDVAEPLLELNTYCAAASAVAMFLLVWLWVYRNFKPIKPFWITRCCRKSRPQPPSPPPARFMTPRWTVPHGIFAFMFATGGFWYAYLTLVHLPPRPVPVISVTRVQPGAGGATILANINAQDQYTEWHLDFGPTATYGRSSDLQATISTFQDQQRSIRLQPLTRGQPVHFRVSATSVGGTISTGDFSFINDGPPIDIKSAPIGGIDWPIWTVWSRLLALFIVMVISAQMLPPIHRGWACGAVAAMLVWCDPVLLMDSHAWPQWDVWILPFFLFAALLASLNWWLLAGVLLAIGCMFKGQLLLAGPILILWPLFEGRWGALARIIIGFLAGAELVTWPWLVNSAAGLRWIETTAFAAGLILIASLMRSALVREARFRVIDPLLGHRRGSFKSSQLHFDQTMLRTLLVPLSALATVMIAAVLVFHGVISRPSRLPWGTLGFFLLLLVLPPWILPRRSIGVWLTAVLAVGVWISSREFNGSYSWATLGFAYGSVRQDFMQMSMYSFSNLPSLLSQSYHWNIHDQMGTLRLSFTTPGPWRIGRLCIPRFAWAWSTDMDVKTALAVLYGICVVISSAAAALHSRRNDRRFLITLVVPWLAFPILMCQMGDRYPIWASAISAAMVAVSLELSLLHIVLAAVSFAMITRQLVSIDPSRWPQLFHLMNPTFPGIAWLMLLVTAIFFVAALVPGRGRAQE